MRHSSSRALAQIGTLASRGRLAPSLLTRTNSKDLQNISSTRPLSQVVHSLAALTSQSLHDISITRSLRQPIHSLATLTSQSALASYRKVHDRYTTPMRRYQTMTSDSRSRLVVIGSGWVGLYLAQYIDHTKYALTVISPRRTSAYTPLLASAACGLITFSCAEESLRTRNGKLTFVKAMATAVDFAKKEVKCEAAFDEDDKALKKRKFKLGYDVLVMAPGQSNTFGTPGVAEHALFMKHVSDAMTLRKRLFDRLEQASLPCVTKKEAAALLSCCIVGGGPTGVEITAELSDLCKHEIAQLYPSVASLLSITIYDVAPNILGTYDQELYKYATKQMRERGVTIATDTVIEKVDATNLHIKGQGKVGYGLLLWVAGNKNVPLVEDMNVRKTKKGLVRILTDDRLRVQKPIPGEGEDESEEKDEQAEEEEDDAEVYDSVYALGDAADISGSSLPTTAEVAVQKSKYLVHLLNAGLDPGAASTAAFKYKDKGAVTYIGGKDGIAEGAGENWSGQKAWLSWRGGSFAWTRTWRNWFGIIATQAMNFVWGKDIMRL
ncbi:hypothetical protein MRB53_038282 [Persea americana]|nr:hypothetical protein MRB53_038282 [Persea americana]